MGSTSLSGPRGGVTSPSPRDVPPAAQRASPTATLPPATPGGIPVTSVWARGGPVTALAGTGALMATPGSTGYIKRTPAAACALQVVRVAQMMQVELFVQECERFRATCIQEFFAELMKFAKAAHTGMSENKRGYTFCRACNEDIPVAENVEAHRCQEMLKAEAAHLEGMHLAQRVQADVDVDRLLTKMHREEEGRLAKIIKAAKKSAEMIAAKPMVAPRYCSKCCFVGRSWEEVDHHASHSGPGHGRFVQLRPKRNRGTPPPQEDSVPPPPTMMTMKRDESCPAHGARQWLMMVKT